MAFKVDLKCSERREEFEEEQRVLKYGPRPEPVYEETQEEYNDSPHDPQRIDEHLHPLRSSTWI